MFLNFWLLLLLFLSSLLGCGNNSVTLKPAMCFLTQRMIFFCEWNISSGQPRENSRLKDKTGAIPGGNVCAMQGIVRQWGCPWGWAVPVPSLSCCGTSLLWGLGLALQTHLQSLWCLGCRTRGRAEGQLLHRVPGIFSVLQAGGFFPLATQKMVFDVIPLPLFAFSCEVVV